MTRRAWTVVSLLFLFAMSSGPALAQASRPARLILTVVDQTGAVIPAATVTVVGLDDATKKTTLEPVKTSEKGIATIDRLVPGRYSIQGQFEGFELGLIRDVRLKAGDNKHVLVLPLKKFAEEVTVGRDRQMVAADRAAAFGTALTREQVEALSDDPEEMSRQLSDLAGPGATIRVDSFEGQQLPPKAQIKAIHITRDAFSAENHSAGGLFLDIITQPGIGPLRGNARFGFADSALDGRNPLIPRKGPSQMRSFGGGLSGSLAKEKASFSVSVNGSSSYSTPNLYAGTTSGVQAEVLNLRSPNMYYNVYGMFDFAVTKDQTMRVWFSRYQDNTENQLAGTFDYPERAYSSDSGSYTFRVQEAGPLGRRFFINTRLYMNVSDSSSTSATEAQTIVINGAATTGGAQRAGGRHTRTFTLQSDLDYVRGIQSWRMGIQLDGGRYRSNDSSNYLGTYTFADWTAYQLATPTMFTRRIGDPNIEYWNLQAGLYVQDDIRVRKNLTLTPGVRFEAQTHIKDWSNIGPRFGITWAPFKSGKTTLRASAGVFYDWFGYGTYEQTLRVNGLHQQEMTIGYPSFPIDPEEQGWVRPTSRYLLGPDLQMASNKRVSAGIDQQITKMIRFGTTYARVQADGLLVGVNLNAPVNGVRPDPRFANIVETVADGKSRSHNLSTYLNFSLSPASPMAAMAGPRFSWKRGLTLGVSYWVAKAENNTDGAFSVPATGTLATEWGPSSGDTRQRISFNVSSMALKNFSASFYLSASTGRPYTMLTGFDTNGDQIINDRPAGVGRNTLRGAGSWDSYGFFGYSFGIGKRTVKLPPGITGISSGPGGLSVTTGQIPDQPRYRLSVTAAVFNPTNHANWSGYRGEMTSPFFMKPTTVSGVRSFTLSTALSF